MSDSKFPSTPPPATLRTWVPEALPRPEGPDALIIPEGQLADALPDGLLEAVEEEGPSVALDPRWKPARDAFLASLDKKWGDMILQELVKEIALRGGAKESARDLGQKVELILCRKFDVHMNKTGKALEPEKLGGYLRVVSRNVVKEHFKAKARRPAIAEGVDLDETPDLALDPEESACLSELWAIFEREPGTLTAQEAEVFVGRVFNRMTFAAIAAVVKRPTSTVHDQHQSAMNKLKAIVARTV